MQCAVCSLQSAVCGLQSVVCSLQSAVCGLQSAVCSLQMSYTATVCVKSTIFLKMSNMQITSGRGGNETSVVTGENCSYTLLILELT